MKVKILEHMRYGKCRVGEEGWIVGRDVARILGYANADGFVRKHVKAENKRFASVRALDSFHCARTALINAVGLDELLVAAENPDSAEIKAWLLGETARLDAVHNEEPAENLPQVLIPQVFNHPQFGNLRAVNIGGEPFFVGKDVATALGYAKPADAVRDHVPDKFKGVSVLETPRGKQQTVIINEAGMYKLVMRSKLPKAEEFSDWACGEVLPSIRKYGFYCEKPPVAEPVKKVRKPLPEYAVVYAARLSNNLVKVGLTTDFNRRIKEVRKETGQDVEEIVTTGNQPLGDARKLESTVKAKFFDKNRGGELYDVPFEQVKTAILAEDKVNKFLALADRLQNPDQKDKLLLHAANLLNGAEIF